MKIGAISQKIFRAKANEAENNSHQTNPFGVTFKGNMISADVFDKKKSDLNENQTKMFKSTLVGSISSFNSALSRRLNSVVSFGRRIKETTVGLWTQANNIDMGDFLAERMPSFRSAYNVNNLKKLPVGELEAMFNDEISSVSE